MEREKLGQLSVRKIARFFPRFPLKKDLPSLSRLTTPSIVPRSFFVLFSSFELSRPKIESKKGKASVSQKSQRSSSSDSTFYENNSRLR